MIVSQEIVGRINGVLPDRQARSQVSRFGGYNIFLGGKDFYFCYMFKTNFSGRNKIWGSQKKLGGHCTRMSPRG